MTDTVNQQHTWQEFRLDGTTLLATAINGEPWFIARDVAAALGYRRAADMLRLAPDPDGRITVELATGGGRQDCVAISEPTLYRIVTRSDHPSARRFQDWVFTSVLPEIRRTGAYTPQLPDRRALAQMVLDAEDAAQAAQQRANALEPSAGTWDHCASPQSSWTIGYAVQILRRDPALRDILTPVRDGQQKLRVAMYQAGLTNYDGGNWVPNPPALDAGRVEVGEDGRVRITPAGLAIMHRHLGGSQPLNTEPGQDLTEAA